MAQARKSKPKAVPEPMLSRAELAAEVRRLVAAGSGLTPGELLKQLPKSARTEAPSVARELVDQGSLFRWAKGKQERFFARDPIATLDREIPKILRAGPFDTARLKREVDLQLRGHGALLAEWLKGAPSRGLIFAQSPKGSAKTKTFGCEPDLDLLLNKVVAELKKSLPALDGMNVPRQRVAAFLGATLGVREAAFPNAGATSPAARPENGEVDRRPFLDALRLLAAENPAGALLPVRELRARAGLDKTRFDATALALSKEGLVVLHHHDHAMGLPEAERDALVRDARGVHYVGVALRRPA